MEPNNRPLNNQPPIAPTPDGANPPQSAPEAQPASASASEAQPAPAPVSQPVAEPQPTFQNQDSIVEDSTKKPKRKTTVALVVILVILAAVGIGFGVWGVITVNQQPATAPTRPVVVDDETSDETSDEIDTDTTEEVEITDTSTIKKLNDMVSTLHESLTYGQGDLTSPTITRKAGVHPELSLYADGNYNNAAKLAVVAAALVGSNSVVPVTTEMASVIQPNFPNLFYYNNAPIDVAQVQEELNGYTFAKDVFENKYREIFGSNPIADNAMGNCPSVFYDNSGYYFVIGRCGGTSPIIASYYKNRYTTQGDNAYVYVNVGIANGENSKVFCDIYPYVQYDDASLACDTFNGTDFTVDATNHDKFAEYRFVFKKATDGSYYFDKVEKVEKTND